MVTNVLEYLEFSEKKYPNRTAYTDRNGSITFSQFAERARSIGSLLVRRQMSGKPVAVFMDKSADTITAFMGAVYGGCFYCPLDVSMPKERIRTILSVLKPAAILTAESGRSQVENFLSGDAKDGAEVLDSGTEILIFEQAVKESQNGEELGRIRRGSTSADPLYVLFTSGSTGIPKGVVVSHRVVINNMEWLEEEYQFGPEDVMGNQVPFYFDVSDHDIYSVMKFGCSMVIIPPELFTFPVKLVQFMNEHRITAIFWVPFALCMVSNLNAFSSELPAFLRYVFFAGEVMPVKQLNYWRRFLPDVKYANMYGPTETYVCTYYNVDREFGEDESLPIGRGCKNIDIMVLDEENRLIRPGDQREGELCVRGCTLALGYYGNPEKTAECFVQNPLKQDYPDTIYRTGDLVRYNERGELVYLSRKDFQIKHLGYRIELGEIETAAQAVEGVESCACIYDPGRKLILLIYSGMKMEKRELTAKLSGKIPKYMLPNRAIYMEELPRNANGKIDRRKLEEMWT